MNSDALMRFVYMFKIDRNPNIFTQRKKFTKCGGSQKKHFNHPSAFIEYSVDINRVSENINDYKPEKDRSALIVFDDMIPENKF